MEYASNLTAVTERDSLRTTEEVLTRRLKNRERQRRYRARKRLEADIKNSCMIEQREAMIIEPKSYGNDVRFGSSGASAPVETRAQNLIAGCPASVHSGRKWKKDARLAHALRRQESPSATEPPSEAETNSEDPTISHGRTFSTGRRDWKADARNKMDVGAPVSCQ